MNKKVLRIVFLTTLIEVVGFSMIIPILPLMFTEPNSHLYALPAGMEISTGYLLLGLLFSTYMIAQFFANPVFGQLSDRLGRRPLYAGATVGTAMSNFLFAFGVATVSLPIMFLARFIDGITGGSLAIGQAAIADVTAPEDRAKNFGMVGAAFGIGFMLGPFLGGVLSDSSLVSFFSAEFAFIVSGMLSIISALVIWRVLPESSPMDASVDIRIWRSVKNLSRAFNSAKGRAIYGLSFLYSFAFTLFTSFFGVFLVQRVGYAEREIGLLFLFLGICIAISQTQLVPKIMSRIDQESSLKIGLGILCLVLLGFVFLIFQTLTLLVGIVIFAASNALSRTAMTTIVSGSATKLEQGQALGVEASVQALGQALPALIAGVVALYFGPIVPMVMSAIVFAFAAWFAWLMRRHLAQ